MEFIPLVSSDIQKKTNRKKNKEPNIFTTACLDMLLKRYKFKDNEAFVVCIENGNSKIYKYSALLITEITTMIAENPYVVLEAKEYLKKLS